jgi:hypothetical protein
MNLKASNVSEMGHKRNDILNPLRIAYREREDLPGRAVTRMYASAGGPGGEDKLCGRFDQRRTSHSIGV